MSQHVKKMSIENKLLFHHKRHLSRCTRAYSPSFSPTLPSSLPPSLSPYHPRDIKSDVANLPLQVLVVDHPGKIKHLGALWVGRKGGEGRKEGREGGREGEKEEKRCEYVRLRFAARAF